ncbi:MULTISPECIES: Txe/YoeB family addiction module toxin [Cupriavidus]|uniref:Putative mRNA interferase YoeB n=3 Tax=Cupriavidus TaxID=106589 RepID=A0A375DAH5_9BURK|nr:MULTISPECIES: Txe/YoeB family addiction module toxin [Cupriavidus]MCO4865586.1 Txe/YoeB family addiction module toxin [Cupriavidus sp. WGlv3]MCO4893306.1 Txe/YoeB family addiction module toxin [Cupriavidus sp. WGtm5]ULX56027.1 addiction module protein [Cupriavidus taiwanensis]CAP63744.1 toxin of the YoeB-YefM toxin-antitoxin system [Cupriavidus taiwanensis LMG 19424]SOY75478.1 toxin of the YoeB-YefM toxin-antitoxin system [Cupriavidus taiwanensis]
MTRRLTFMPDAWEDYVYWQGQDRKTLKRINALIQDAQREPFDGLGKPEPLKGNLSGYWSRRIDDSNRLVYFANDDELTIIACRLHYGDK